MGVLQRIKDFLYRFVVEHQLIFLYFPLTQRIWAFLDSPERRATHKITDKTGKSIKVCKINGRTYPPFGVERIKNVRNVSIRRDDVILCGYPKTGCHWVHELLHMLVTGTTELTTYGKMIGGMVDALPHLFLDSLASPRVLNSHLLFDELPEGVRTNRTKIILTMRNPKDTVVSFYNHVINLRDFYHYQGEFDAFFDLFIEGNIEYGSYFDFYFSWSQLLKNPDDHPVLLLKYEDLKTQPVECVKRIAAFLDIPLTDKFAADVIESSSFSNMKAKRSDSPGAKIFRKGTVGDWRNWLNDDQRAAIDRRWECSMQGSTSYPPHY